MSEIVLNSCVNKYKTDFVNAGSLLGIKKLGLATPTHMRTRNYTCASGAFVCVWLHAYVHAYISAQANICACV